MEKRSDQQSRAEGKTRLLEQINADLRSSNYSRALDLVRDAAAEFANDAELSELEKLAQDGLERKAEADRLITNSQELFAQRKSAEAIQLLREAYELDKSNSLARSILANALVEHAQSMVESDWLKAETLTNQALALNPAHPTAKTILSLIVTRKETSSVEEWVAQARKLQSSGDLFAALAWVAEGLAVHPHDLKLLQIQDEIQRDQDARRRQARRADLEDLRRMQHEISGAADVAAKQALAERIQALAAKHWTDGEILSIANALLLRLGLVPQESSSASSRNKGAAVIFHVPRTSPAKPSRVDATQAPAVQVLPRQAPSEPTPARNIPTATMALSKGPPTLEQASKVATAAPEAQVLPPKAVTVPVAVTPVPTVKATSTSSPAKPPARSNTTPLIVISVVAIVLVAATFFFTRKHYAPAVAQTSAATPSIPAPAASAAAVAAPTVSVPAAPPTAEATPEPSPPAPVASSDTAAGEATADDQLPAGSGHDLGSLLVVAGQDNARVFLNGKRQRQLTQAGQLRLPNLEPRDYVVQVSKTGFQDPAAQTISIRKGEQSRLVFNLQPQPSLSSSRPASLTIQGGIPGTTVLVDQTLVGTIQPDGTLSLSTINAGDHTVELRKERFKPRQFKKQFVAGETIAFGAADAALEAALGEVKITFSPSNANVAIAKGDLLKIVSSGVPLDLAAGTYTLTARTAERFTRSATLEIVSGQSKTLDLSLAPSGMSKWDDFGAWKPEGNSFVRKGGDFVLYGVVPTAGTFVFSAMPRGHLLQWVVNYIDPKNYVLFQIDDKNFYRSVIRSGEKTDEIIVPHKGDKKSFRTFQIRVSRSELVHEIEDGDSWTVLDRWTQPGANLSLGKFGFYIPGNDQVELSSFAHYADLNVR